MHRTSPAWTIPLTAVLFLTGGPRAVAAEPWEQTPTPEQLRELRKQVAALGGRSFENSGGVETLFLPAADLAKLPPIRFRVGVTLENQPADADLKALGRHPGIVELSVANSKITDAGVKELAVLKGLADLDLSHTAITDRGLADLPPLASLRDLNLFSTKVTADGGRHLAGRKLRTLELPPAARTNVGLKHYVAAVEKLVSFDNHYGWPGVTDEGLSVLAGNESLRRFTWWPEKPIGPTLRKILPTLKNLDHLFLERSPIEDDDLKSLAALPKLATLYLSGTRVTDAGLRHLVGLKNLRNLHLAGTKITDTGLTDLARLPALRELYLMNTVVTDAGMRALSAAPELRELHLEGTKVSPAGMRVFAGKKLAMVWGDEELRTEDVLLILLPNMPERDELELVAWRLTDAGLAEVVKRRGVKRLLLRGTFSDKGLASLTALADLRYLRVITDKFTAGGVRAWRDLAKLGSLSLAGTVSEAVLLELQGFKSLTSLEVEGTLTVAEMRALAGIEKLSWLTLDGVGFTDAGVEALARSPSLAGLSVRQSSLTDEGLLALAPLKTLKYVDVSYSGVTLKGKAAFAKLRPDCEVYDGD